MSQRHEEIHSNDLVKGIINLHGNQSIDIGQHESLRNCSRTIKNHHLRINFILELEYSQSYRKK